ncbi:MAG: DEAD/DEAH box helicase [Lachnospiraceae bacterium]|nr:DEAD/DEAH box helicase [Lachnospiraceae bacterium]
MSITKSEYMLKYQKAKVKLLEYDIPEQDYPQFKLNYRDLAFPTVYIISNYAEAIISNDIEGINEKKKDLQFCSEFYDAAMKSREQIHNDINFALTGAIAYFFGDNFGSAMVILSEIRNMDIPDDMRGTLVDVFYLIFYGKKYGKVNNQIVEKFEQYLNTDEVENLLEIAEENCEKAYGSNNEIDAFFADALYAIIKIAIDNSARTLLPLYSGLSYEKWESYLSKRKSIKMVWPAQKLIGEKGILKGKNSIVQLPTGVGKTKSIELIVRSMFLAERGDTALIVAPLRALCNEITDDLGRAFVKEASINQFSDLLEIDFLELFSKENEKKILVCTPEKLQFIFHHEPELMSEIDLYVFDEGHMFDDMSRGAMYELLVADIKKNIQPQQQLVLLSAVLSNADKILEWILGDEGVLAFDKGIRSTPKVVGFASSEDEIHYFSNTFEEEDFYIPKAIKRFQLQSKKSNAKPKFFPENKANDIALYYTNQLCSNGGVAIYMSQRRYVPTILKRLIEVQERGYEPSKLITVSDEEEINRLKKLIADYYGEESIYYKAASLGILPHYSSLPNGLRVSVEYAFRKNKIKAVACTSTLAQGVNIPIKYLIMTSLKSAQNMISIRNFQNLIGRTARSGVFTEGSILITDTKLFDDRNAGKGYFDWKNTIALFEPENSEACSSSILSVVQNFSIDYELKISGESVCTFIIKHINEEWPELMKNALNNYLIKKNKDNPLNRQVVAKRISEYSKIIDTLENEICYALICKMHESEISDELIQNQAIEKLNESLAIFLSNESEKELLENLVKAIGEKIKKHIEVVPRVSKTMVGVESAEKILNWIEQNEINVIMYNENDMLNYVVELFNAIYSDDFVDIELCKKWISGESYKEIAESIEMSILDIEKKCGQCISYQLSFLIGNIIDYLDAESVNLEVLKTLQRKVKYGVNTDMAIAICDKVFNDRIIANYIVKEIGNIYLGEDEIVNVIKYRQTEVENVLEHYPTYFSDRITFLTR